MKVLRCSGGICATTGASTAGNNHCCRCWKYNHYQEPPHWLSSCLGGQVDCQQMGEAALTGIICANASKISKMPKCWGHQMWVLPCSRGRGSHFASIQPINHLHRWLTSPIEEIVPTCRLHSFPHQMTLFLYHVTLHMDMGHSTCCDQT